MHCLGCLSGIDFVSVAIVGVQQRPSTANTGQRQNAEHVHTAAEDLNMDRLLETASSGGMSAGLELDLSGNNTEAMSRGN